MYTSTDLDSSDPNRTKRGDRPVPSSGRRAGTGPGAWVRTLVPALGLLLVMGCGGGDGGGEPAAGEGESAAQAPEPEETQAAQPQTIADIFPEGEGRTLVLNNCAACHAVACAAIGQRSPARWEALQESHEEHIPSMSEEDLETVFTYLQSNFDNTQPEPEIPQAFLQRGCTPF